MEEMRREVKIVQNTWKKAYYKWFINEDVGKGWWWGLRRSFLVMENG
jgi:hypothetical protein